MWHEQAAVWTHSLIWLGVVAAFWIAAQVVAARRRWRGRSGIFAAGPCAALVDLALWQFTMARLSFVLWATERQPSWNILDVVDGWRRLAGWLLGVIGVIGAEPISAMMQSGSHHDPPFYVMIGPLNEAALVALTATAIAVSLSARR